MCFGENNYSCKVQSVKTKSDILSDSKQGQGKKKKWEKYKKKLTLQQAVKNQPIIYIITHFVT